jgi:hypothetical protein
MSTEVRGRLSPGYREPVARIYEIDGIVPVIDPSAFVHPDAVLVGDVIVGPR